MQTGPGSSTLEPAFFAIARDAILSLVSAAWLILKNSGLQFAFLFGAGLIGGAALTLLSKLTNNIFRQFRWPSAGTYLFGWIGVPVHEFCHAFFCKLFLHEIQEIKWFDPKASDGAHGSVTHGYQPWNVYQRVGHFFIGLGPVLLGPAILVGLFFLCVPSARHIWPALLHGGTHATLLSVKAVVSVATLKTYGFWIFVYFAFAIASQIELSSADLEQAAKGAIPVFGLLLIFNLGAWALGYRWHSRVVEAGHTVTATISGVYAFSTLIALATFVGCALIFGFLNFLCGRGFINPFRR
jgi:hypothetical protein